MNEELQKQLAALLAGLMNIADDAATFAGDHIPPLVQEKIAFGRAWETTAFVLIAAVVLMGGYWLFRLWRGYALGEIHEDWIPAPIFGTVVWLFSAGMFIGQLHRVMLVWFAPRLYIVEWLKSMVTQ